MVFPLGRREGAMRAAGSPMVVARSPEKRPLDDPAAREKCCTSHAPRSGDLSRNPSRAQRGRHACSGCGAGAPLGRLGRGVNAAGAPSLCHGRTPEPAAATTLSRRICHAHTATPRRPVAFTCLRLRRARPVPWRPATLSRRASRARSAPAKPCR